MASWNVSTHLTCVCTKTNLFVEYSVNGKTMKHRAHFLSLRAQAYLPFGSDVFQLPTSCSNHVVKKNFETFSGIFFTWVDDLRTPRGQWTMRKMLFDSTLIFSCHLVSPPDFSYLINSNVTKSSTMPGCIETLKKNVLQPIHQVDTSMRQSSWSSQSSIIKAQNLNET